MSVICVHRWFLETFQSLSKVPSVVGCWHWRWIIPLVLKAAHCYNTRLISTLINIHFRFFRAVWGPDRVSAEYGGWMLALFAGTHIVTASHIYTHPYTQCPIVPSFVFTWRLYCIWTNPLSAFRFNTQTQHHAPLALFFKPVVTGGVEKLNTPHMVMWEGNFWPLDMSGLPVNVPCKVLLRGNPLISGALWENNRIGFDSCYLLWDKLVTCETNILKE